MDASLIIRKTAAELRVPPNFSDYAQERTRFSWDSLDGQLADLRDGVVNIAFAAVGRHVSGGLQTKTAYRFLARDNAPQDISYGELAALSNRFCNVLRWLGIGKGERVFVLAGRIPELYVAVLGRLKNGSVVSPLFSAFGPEPITTRVNLGAGKVLVTTDALYERKVAKWRDKMPTPNMCCSWPRMAGGRTCRARSISRCRSSSRRKPRHLPRTCRPPMPS